MGFMELTFFPKNRTGAEWIRQFVAASLRCVLLISLVCIFLYNQTGIGKKIRLCPNCKGKLAVEIDGSGIWCRTCD